jgi:LysM repeat protein
MARLHLHLTLAWLLALLAPAGSWTAEAGKKHRSYEIQKGDTPVEVARRFGVPVDELMRFNNVATEGFRAGDTIRIPSGGEVTGEKYVVEPGDSVARIADFHGVSQRALRDANGLRPGDTLRAGQELTIPMRLRGGATRSHVVRKGDTLASIAKRHGVSVGELAHENKIDRDTPLEIGRTLIIPDDEDDVGRYRPKKVNKLEKSGEKVPGGVLHTVQPGQSLWSIARAYNVSGDRIAKRNGFSRQDPLTVGRKILIPGADNVVPVRVKGFAIQPVRFVRVRDNESIEVRLMTRSGKIRPWARKKLSLLARDMHHEGRRGWRLLHPRLLHMLQRIAERWPGRTIDIVSGYRVGSRGKESKHAQGRAVDFRVRGIPNRQLYEFCTELPRSGCGYYPNSVFVHMDARSRSAVWTDTSAPGEDAKYVEKGRGK